MFKIIILVGQVLLKELYGIQWLAQLYRFAGGIEGKADSERVAILVEFSDQQLTAVALILRLGVELEVNIVTLALLLKHEHKERRYAAHPEVEPSFRDKGRVLLPILPLLLHGALY